MKTKHVANRRFIVEEFTIDEMRDYIASVATYTEDLKLISDLANAIANNQNGRAIMNKDGTNLKIETLDE